MACNINSEKYLTTTLEVIQSQLAAVSFIPKIMALTIHEVEAAEASEELAEDAISVLENILNPGIFQELFTPHTNGVHRRCY
jgi:hypothetical protein